jgi:hypothetical protein
MDLIEIGCGGVEWIDLAKQTQQTPWSLARKRTIPTERPPLFDEI